MRSKRAFYQRKNFRALEQVKLCGILFEDACEGKFLDGAPPIIRRVQGDVGWHIAFLWLFHQQELLSVGIDRLRWPQAQVDIKQVCLSSLGRVQRFFSDW